MDNDKVILKLDWQLVTDPDRANAIRTLDILNAKNDNRPRVFKSIKTRVYELNLTEVRDEALSDLFDSKTFTGQDGEVLTASKVSLPEGISTTQDFIGGYYCPRDEIESLSNDDTQAIEDIVSHIQTHNGAPLYKSAVFFRTGDLRVAVEYGLHNDGHSSGEEAFVATNAPTLKAAGFTLPTGPR